MTCYADEQEIHPEMQVWMDLMPEVANDFAVMYAVTPGAYVELGVHNASRLADPVRAQAFLKLATQSLYRYEKGH